MFASVMSLRHLGSSVRNRWLSSLGEPAIDSKYCLSRKFFCTSGSAKVLRTSLLILATTSLGMLGGPYNANHDTALKPGTVSAIAGTSGNSAIRFGAPMPISLTPPALACGKAVPTDTNISWM